MNYPVRKACFFTEEQAEQINEIAKDPRYKTNAGPSFTAVVRDAVALFLAEKSTTVDDSDSKAA